MKYDAFNTILKPCVNSRTVVGNFTRTKKHSVFKDAKLQNCKIAKLQNALIHFYDGKVVL